MTHMGNILGFTLGFLDLSSFPLLDYLGGGNFRKFCVIIILVLGFTVWVTCATTHETAREKEFGVRAGCVFFFPFLGLPKELEADELMLIREFL